MSEFDQHKPEIEKTPEATYSPEVIFERLKNLKGETIGEGTILVKQRQDKEDGSGKGFSTEVKTDETTELWMYTPSPSHEGYTWNSVRKLTSNSLITFGRRVLIGGETKSQKSDEYKALQSDMSGALLAIVDAKLTGIREDVVENLTQDFALKFNELVNYNASEERVVSQSESDTIFGELVKLGYITALLDPSERDATDLEA